MNKYWRFGSFLLLASCTLGPDYRQPQFFDNNQVAESLHLHRNEAVQPVNLDWYADFNEPELNRLIIAGIQVSPDVGQAVAKLHAARQSLRINAVSTFPTFDLDGSYHKTQDTVSYGIPLTTDYYQTGLDASWEIDIWGGGRRLTESSLALYRAAAADLDNVRLTLTAEIAKNYVSLRQTQEQLRISRQNYQIQQNIYSLVKQKFDAGLANDLTLNQSRYLVENTAAQIPSLETAEEAYLNALNILTGMLPGSLNSRLLTDGNNLVGRRFDFDLNRLYNLPAEVIRRRPDVQAAEQNLIAQNAKIGQAVANLFPSVSLSGFLGWQAQNPSGLFGGGSDMYSYSAGVTVPLFHWGALLNNVELQKYAATAQTEAYRGSLLNAASEIRNSMVSLEKEYRSNTSASKAWQSQKEVSDLTLLKYKEGLVEFSDVLTTQQDLLTAQTALIQSNAAIYQDIIAFYKAVGGGYSKNYQPRKAAADTACALCKG